MPALTPTSGNTQGEPAAASSPSLSPSPFNKIPILNSQSRSFFLFLLAGAAIVGLIVAFFLISRGGIPSTIIPGQQVEDKLDPNAPAAIVNGKVITIGQHQEFVDIETNSYKTIQSKIGQEASQDYLNNLPKFVLDKLIKEELLRQYLINAENGVTEVDVTDYIQDLVDNEFSGDFSQYESFLAEGGSNLEIAKSNIRNILEKTRVMELEELNPTNIDVWYQDYLTEANVEIKIKLGE